MRFPLSHVAFPVVTRVPIWLLALLVAPEIGGAAAAVTPPAPHRQAEHSVGSRARALEPAASAFEDLADPQESGNSSRAERTLKTGEPRIHRARALLGTSAALQVDSLLAAVKTAIHENRIPESALAAAQGYRVIVEAAWPSPSAPARQLAMLDYVGYRTAALAAIAPVDWESVENSTSMGHQQWTLVRARVHSPGIRDAMDTAMLALGEAAHSRYPKMTRLSAQLVLDLVDLVESDQARGRP